MKNLYLICLFLSYHAYAEPLVINSGVENTSLVELYTSEGCSSCPPADAFINKLSTHPKLFKSFVPIVFHVDYWNYLGWKDPFSSDANSLRQRRVFKAMGANSVYTPGLVKDGLEFREWRRGVGNLQKKSKKVGMLSLKLENNRAQIEWRPIQAKKSLQYEYHIATMLMGVKSKVTAGENAGKMLTHNFTVCSLTSRKTKKKKPTLIVDLCPKIAARKAIAVWVTKAGQHRPLQAMGGMISN